MILTIYWEDAGVKPRNYGPDQLLRACVADDLGLPFDEAKRLINGVPLKGVGNLLRKLRSDGAAAEPLCAVIDRDKILDHLGTPPPPACKQGITAAIRSRAPGAYKIALLHDNMETLVAESARVMGRLVPARKTREARDDELQRLALAGTRVQRDEVRRQVDGFGRVAAWAAETIKHHRGVP